MRWLTVSVQAWLFISIVGPLIWWIAVEIGIVVRRRRFHQEFWSPIHQHLRSAAMLTELKELCDPNEEESP